MYHEIKDNLNDLMKHAKIIRIFRVLDLICFDFLLRDGRKLFLHAQCLVRLFDAAENLVLCSYNLYRPSRRHPRGPFDYQKIGSTLFDDSLRDYSTKLCETEIAEAIFDGKDLKIKFLNGMYLDLLTFATSYDDLNFFEDYRLYGEDKAEEHYII